MQNKPDGGENLSGNGDLYFHFALSPNNGLGVTELAEEASLRFGSGPRAFDKSFPQVLVSVRDAPGLNLSCAFLVAWFQSSPGNKVGDVFKRRYF